MDKNFLNYEQQIIKLKGKKLIIENEQDAITILKKYSYFMLINGYKTPFKNKDGEYKKNTKFNDIYLLYNFDDNLRHIFMKYILKIELHIKSLLSYHFCEEFGESQDKYQNTLNYNYTTTENQQNINDLVQILKNKLVNNKKVLYIAHQKNKHKNVPLWVLVKVLTLGNISKMYAVQQPQIQTKISKEFLEINEKELEKMLDILTRYRNVCAHNERLYDFKYIKNQISTNKIHAMFGIDKSKTKGTTLFDIIIIFKYLLSPSEFADFYGELLLSIKNINKKTNQIQKSQLLTLMAFPKTWEKIETANINDIVVKTTICK